MQITYPLGLLGLLLAVPIIVMHFARPAARQVSVSTMMFWDQVLEQQGSAQSGRRGRPRAWLSLLLQLITVVALVGVLTQPQMTVLQTPTTALVVDNSLSMTAGVSGDTQLNRAKQYAQQLVAELSEEVAVLTADRRAPISIGPSSDRASVRAAIDAIDTTADASLPFAIDLAKQLLAERSESQIVVLTDNTTWGLGQLSRFPQAKVKTFSAGATDNVGITRFTARRGLVDPVDFEVLIEVTNYGKAAASFELDMTLGGQLVDVVPLQLEAGGQWRQVRSYASSAGGELIARVSLNDALAVDNNAEAQLEACESMPVVLVGPSSYFLEQVFRAIPLVDLTVRDELPEVLPQDALVVFHQIVPEIMPECHVLLVDPLNGFGGVRVGQTLSDPVIASQVQGGALMAHLQLEGLTLNGSRQIEITDEHRVLAATPTGNPIYASIDRDHHRLLVLCASLAQGELPRRAAFPILMSNIVSACRQGSAPVVSQNGTGEPAAGYWGSVESSLEPFADATSTVTFDEFDLATRRPPIWVLIGLLALAALIVEWICDRRSAAG